jgi:hypothetical protein
VLLDFPPSKVALYAAAIATFLVVAAAAPFMNYRGGAFFAALLLLTLAPPLLIDLLLWIALINSATIAAIRVRHRSNADVRTPLINTALLAAALACNSWLLVWLIATNVPVWSSAAYRVLAEGSLIVLAIAVAGLMSVASGGSLVEGFTLLGRRCWCGLLWFTVIPVAYFCFVAGTKTNDVLTVRSCSQGIQSALQAVHAGRALPPLSRSYPYRVLKGSSDAFCSLGGMLGGSDYIVYDVTDSSQPAVLKRMGTYLDPVRCGDRAREIMRHYYWVTEGC